MVPNIIPSGTNVRVHITRDNDTLDYPGTVVGYKQVNEFGDIAYEVESHNDAAVDLITPQNLTPHLAEGQECEWFALCEEPATGVVFHPVLHHVPVCVRHDAFARN